VSVAKLLLDLIGVRARQMVGELHHLVASRWGSVRRSRELSLHARLANLPFHSARVLVTGIPLHTIGDQRDAYGWMVAGLPLLSTLSSLKAARTQTRWTVRY